MSTPGVILRVQGAPLWIHKIAHFHRFHRFGHCEQNDLNDHLDRIWTRGVFLPPCGGVLLTEE